VSDCSQVTDGAAVVILCSEKYAREKGLKDLAIVKGYGHRTAPLLFDKKIADNANSEYVLPWTRQACLDAYKRAGLTVDDIDVFETHDCFTQAELMQYEAFGLAEHGKGSSVLADGITHRDGKLPTNVSGGLKAKGHPVGATGVSQHVVTAMQLTGEAGDMQLDHVDRAAVFNMGGAAVANYASILERVK
jgi:acetyl-CoA C-acetyltransferase